VSHPKRCGQVRLARCVKKQSPARVGKTPDQPGRSEHVSKAADPERECDGSQSRRIRHHHGGQRSAASASTCFRPAADRGDLTWRLSGQTLGRIARLARHPAESQGLPPGARGDDASKASDRCALHGMGGMSTPGGNGPHRTQRTPGWHAEKRWTSWPTGRATGPGTATALSPRSRLTRPGYYSQYGES